jgi:hypothetical protein
LPAGKNIRHSWRIFYVDFELLVKKWRLLAKYDELFNNNDLTGLEKIKEADGLYASATN